MIRAVVLRFAAVAAATVFPAWGWTQDGKQEPQTYAQTFLKKAGEMQQAKIALAQLTDQRAANKRVVVATRRWNGTRTERA